MKQICTPGAFYTPPVLLFRQQIWD
jgi:hypothetical protein